ncbi:MAG: biopolymer transporter ExbD [Gammaproteobacteria bacterium]|nr:MAG: biopolymer transporter ExbD [Gammaproteobacteria bacterium]
MRESIAEQLREEEDVEINLTPMLDVVFIMLIFFIVTAVFVKNPGVEINRPEAVTAFVPDKGSIFIAVTAANEIWADNRNVGPDGIKAAIERLHTENPEGGVVIMADSAAANEFVLNVMDAARAAGITNVTIAASVL